MHEKSLAGGQQAHAARVPLQERRAELVFQRADLSAQRRLRDVKPLGGASHAALFGHRDEVLQLRQAHDGIVAPERKERHTKTVLVALAEPAHARRVQIERLGRRQRTPMRLAGRVAAETLRWVGAQLRAGMTTAEVDRLVREDTRRRNAVPSQLGYHGFPGAVCTSRNDVVCHGIPRDDETLHDGDIVSIDVTSNLDGWHGDTCRTFAIGTPTRERAHVMEVAERCCRLGISIVRDGVRLGDVGHAVDALARAEGCSVVREVGGHGIGRKMHLPPHVSFFGEPGTGRRLREGMAITIEPIVMLGTPRVVTDDDGWTMRTHDGSPAAQFEHTILVTREGCEVLTR